MPVYRELGGYRDDLFKNSSDLDMWLRICRKYPIGVLEVDHVEQVRLGDVSEEEVPKAGFTSRAELIAHLRPLV